MVWNNHLNCCQIETTAHPTPKTKNIYFYLLLRIAQNFVTFKMAPDPILPKYTQFWSRSWRVNISKFKYVHDGDGTLWWTVKFWPPGKSMDRQNGMGIFLIGVSQFGGTVKCAYTLLRQQILSKLTCFNPRPSFFNVFMLALFEKSERWEQVHITHVVKDRQNLLFGQGRISWKQVTFQYFTSKTIDPIVMR